MILAVYAATVLLFCLLFVRLTIVARVKGLFVHFDAAMQVMRNPGLSDAEKEREIRRAALQSASATAMVLVRLAVLLAVTTLPFLLAVQAGAFEADTFVAFSLKPSVLLGTLLVIPAWKWLRPNLKRQADKPA